MAFSMVLSGLREAVEDMAAAAGHETVDDIDVTDVAPPARPPHPPAARPTVRILPLIADIVSVAACSKDTPVQPMEIVASRFVCAQLWRDEGANCFQPSTATL